MNKAMLTIGVIILGIAGLLTFNIIQDYSKGSELDYYLLKEVTEASMFDAVDVTYYSMTGQIRIDRESFADSFARRFSQSVAQDRDYKIKIYDINETPPKVSVKVESNTTSSLKNANVPITTNIDAILETKYDKNDIVETLLRDGRINYWEYYQAYKEANGR